MLLLFFATSSPGAYSLTADAGAYTLSGQDAALVAALTMAAAEGAYTLTGQDTGLIIPEPEPTPPVFVRTASYKLMTVTNRVRR